ncbi:DOR family [Popillia japonica]|uniref:DOR family n=1 Tax=Popillia japonica TaxID=7064 RepID=A0AAW1L9E3_POPJA
MGDKESPNNIFLKRLRNTMFSQLANYLLGTTSNDHQQESESRIEETNTRLTSRLSEDDWVLVDRDSEGNSEVSSVESLDGFYDNEEDENFDRSHALTTILTRTSSTSSLPCINMEESWYITPPPCFASAGPIILETSPLENLLIEHPSMSVYQHSQPIYIARRHNSAPLQPVTDLNTDETVAEPVQRIAEDEVQIVAATRVHVPRRTRVEVLQQQQIIKMKNAQKVQVQKACQSLKRGYLERSNKAREVNCRNQRQRRGERSQGARRSHANNNRKC